MEVKVCKQTRCVQLPTHFMGYCGEHLQERLEFSFIDQFVDGQARLEYELNSGKKYIFLDKKDEKYSCDVSSALTEEGQIHMQLVISEGISEEETPIFKSAMFNMMCHKSINAEIEEPEEAAGWLEVANTKLNQVDNLDIKATQTSNGTNINITDKQGVTSSTEVVNGKDGVDGKDGYTPVKGVDYFTQSDINQIVNQVLAQIPTSEGVDY